jgi:hypothetical protein
MGRAAGHVDRVVGTVFGDRTIAELRDLVAAKDVEMSELDAAIAAFGPTWAEKDIDAVTAWDRDWTALLARYAPARVAAQKKLDSTGPLSDDWTPAEGEYERLIRSLQKEDGKTSPGDHIDLVGRIIDAGAKLDYRVPQPVANDVDLSTFLRASKVLKEIDPGLIGKAGFSTIETVGIGAGLALLALLLLRR